MPKLAKCWYKDCDSNDKDKPKLIFYKFPKDPDRCELWVNNCANKELCGIWLKNPTKMAAYRVCQKHFLGEFLGTSSRLVGHAVPAPYGVSLDQDLDAEKFMVECASLKDSFHPTKQSFTNKSQHQLDYTISTSSDIDTKGNGDYLMPSSIDQIVINKSTDQIASSPVISNLSHHQLTENPILTPATSTTALFPSCHNHCSDNEPSQPQDFHSLMTNKSAPIDSQVIGSPLEEQQTKSTDEQSTSAIVKLNRNANPKICYDRNGKLVSIKYPPETLPVSLGKTDEDTQHQAHVLALKHKVRHYQRRLAVINHRYQKLKSQMKGRSNKMRLLESLNTCKGDFDPCVFEMFKRQIKGPISKQGNRWSDDIKFFSSNIYLRSRSAYKYVRKTIDLPSESIVKRFICEKKLSKANPGTLSQEVDQSGETEDNNKTSI